MRKPMLGMAMTAMLLAAGLSACGGSASEGSAGSGKKAAAESAANTEISETPEEKTEDNKKESTAETAKKDASAGAAATMQKKEQKELRKAPEHLSLHATREWEELLNDAGENIGGLNWTILSVQDAEHPELMKALEEYGKETEEWKDAAKKDLKDYYDEFLAKREDYYDISSAFQSAVPVRADDRVLSIMEFYSSYFDSHTEDHRRRGFCLDPATGREMPVSQVLESPEKAGAVIAEAIRKAYPDLRFDSDMEEKVTAFAKNPEPEEGFGFNLGYHELRIFVDDGILTSRIGGVDVPLSFADYPDLVKEEYREIPEDYMYWVQCNEPYILDETGRGFSMEVVEDNPDEMYCRVQINAGEASIFSTYMAEPDGYLVHVDGKDWLYMGVPTGDVSFPSEIFDLNGSEIPVPRNLETCVDYEYAGTDPAKAEFAFWDEDAMDISRTVRHIGEDGLPEGVSVREMELPEFEDVCRMLEYNDAAKQYLDRGMSMRDDGTDEIRGAECRIIALGTDSAEKFTAEVRFAVCNWDYIFEYNPLKDEWEQRY